MTLPWEKELNSGSLSDGEESIVLLSDGDVLDALFDEALEFEVVRDGFLSSQAEPNLSSDNVSDESLDFLPTESLPDLEDESTKKTKKQIAQILFSCIGVHSAFKVVLAKLEGMRKLINPTNYIFLMRMFSQSISIGFEKKVSELIARSEGGPPNPAVIPSSKAQGEEKSPLEKIHQNVKKSIFKHAEDVAKSFVETFNLVLKTKLESLKKTDQGLAKIVFAGDDFLLYPTGNVTAIGTRFRAFRDSEYGHERIPTIDEMTSGIDAVAYGLYSMSDIGIAYVSAVGSAVFVQIDDLGRFLGGEMAKVMIALCSNLPKLGRIDLKQQSLAFISDAAKAVMAQCYLWDQVSRFIESWSNVLAFGAIDSLYYPVVSGIVIGLYEEAEKRDPEMFTRLMAESKKDVDENMPAELRDKSLWGAVKICYKRARRSLEKYDKIFDVKKTGLSLSDDDERMYRTLIKNSASAKKFLEARHAFLRLFKFHPWSENYLLPVVLTVRASPLIVSAFVSKISFDAAKFYTKKGVGLADYLGKSIEKVFSKKSAQDQAVQTEVLEESERDVVEQKASENLEGNIVPRDDLQK